MSDLTKLINSLKISLGVKKATKKFDPDKTDYSKIQGNLEFGKKLKIIFKDSSDSDYIEEDLSKEEIEKWVYKDGDDGVLIALPGYCNDPYEEGIVFIPEPKGDKDVPDPQWFVISELLTFKNVEKVIVIE